MITFINYKYLILTSHFVSLSFINNVFLQDILKQNKV